MKNKEVILSKYLHKDSDGLFSIAYWIDWQQLADDEMFDGIYDAVGEPKSSG